MGSYDTDDYVWPAFPLAILGIVMVMLVGVAFWTAPVNGPDTSKNTCVQTCC